jgi:hypothetical protein
MLLLLVVALGCVVAAQNVVVSWNLVTLAALQKNATEVTTASKVTV